MDTAKFQGHTPGPWDENWIMRGDGGIDGYRENGEPIPGLRPVVCHIIGRTAEAGANCCLIAAAPTLLAEHAALRTQRDALQAALRDIMTLADEGAYLDLSDRASTPVARKAEAALALPDPDAPDAGEGATR